MYTCFFQLDCIVNPLTNLLFIQIIKIQSTDSFTQREAFGGRQSSKMPPRCLPGVPTIYRTVDTLGLTP